MAFPEGNSKTGLQQAVEQSHTMNTNHQAIYIFIVWFLFLLFSLPNLSGRRLDVYHILPHVVWP